MGVTTENWLDQLRQEFDRLYARFQDDALPALMHGPLSGDASIKRLPSLFDDTKRDLAQARSIPVAIVGETGVGKSTLLNALLDTDFLPTGVVGSQTAAFITIAYSPDWTVICHYISEAELDEIFDDAWAQADDQSEAVSAEIVERARAKVRALLALGEEQALPPRTDPPLPLRLMVQQSRRTFHTEDEARAQLLLHAKKQYWPITRAIDVHGPFDMLRSGVVISDLPGAGDINKARRGRAAEAISNAGQILIAAEARGLKSALLEQLESDGRLPHRLFREKQPVQIILIGTKLDSASPDADTKPQEVIDLGLDPEAATKADVFSAVVKAWERHVLGTFRQWLTGLSEQFIEGAHAERAAQVDRIMGAVQVVPTNSSDWRRLAKGKKGVYVGEQLQTGIPLLRKAIAELAEAQNATTRAFLTQRINECDTSVLDAIQSSEQMLGADIAAILKAVEDSRAQMEEIQDRYAQVIDALRVKVLDRFQLLREKLEVSIETASNKMARLGRERVADHLQGLHWMSLRATVRNDGRWTTNGGRGVNLRDNMGGEITRLVPQAFAKLTEERLGTDIETTRTALIEQLKKFTDEIRGVVDKHSNDDLTRRHVSKMFATALKKAEREINEQASLLIKQRDETTKDMQGRIDKAVDRTVAEICGECQNDHGVGWKNRSMSKISDGTARAAELARKRAMEVADGALKDIEDAVKEFCAAAVRETEELASDLPTVLNEAVERVRITGPQQQRARLSNVGSAWQARA